MKPIYALLLVLGFVACKSSQKATTTSTAETQKESIPVEEEVFIPDDEILKTAYPDSLFLRMQRTSCFGQCPVYHFEVYESGLVIFEGVRFAKYEGTNHAQLSKEEMKQIQERAKEIDFFSLDHVYDSNISDFPSCYLYLKAKKEKHHVKTRRAGPVELSGFQKWVDELVLSKEFTRR